MAPKRSQSRQKALRQNAARNNRLEAVAASETATQPATAKRAPGKRPSRSYRKPKRSFWQGPYPYVAVVAAAVIVVLVIVLISRANTGSTTTGNLKAAIKDATSVSAVTFNQVGTGSLTASSLPFAATSSPTTLTGADGKPEILYMGGEYCPYCAADRWVMLTALSRFGTFSGVQSMFSSSTDVYPSTPTFTFANASYKSSYVDFVPVELYTRTGATLQTPTAAQSALMAKYDPKGSLPFVLIGGTYLGISSPFSPQSLAGQSQQQIAANLSDPTQQSTKDILGNANLFTAAICSVTNGSPSSVCQSPGVESASQLLGVQ